ncbi:hypothetical protein L7E35_004668 [Vibrio parahaemolyticus]|nr:hypothetical protein [Vibrio parahaemolyticus]EIV1599722.1 hypothetical protein [Vibrio parahaemolyticus]
MKNTETFYLFKGFNFNVLTLNDAVENLDDLYEGTIEQFMEDIKDTPKAIIDFDNLMNSTIEELYSHSDNLCVRDVKEADYKLLSNVFLSLSDKYDINCKMKYNTCKDELGYYELVFQTIEIECNGKEYFLIEDHNQLISDRQEYEGIVSAKVRIYPILNDTVNFDNTHKMSKSNIDYQQFLISHEDDTIISDIYYIHEYTETVYNENSERVDTVVMNGQSLEAFVLKDYTEKQSNKLTKNTMESILDRHKINDIPIPKANKNIKPRF